MYRRALWAAALVAGVLMAGVGPGLAKVDDSLVGQWDADLGQGKLISMTILGDGYWLSEHVENGRVVGQMAGTLEHKPASPGSGTLIFTPEPGKTKVSAEHGAAQVETDQYVLADGGRVLRLKPGSGGVMEFRKQQ